MSARVENYQPSDLDTLLVSGELVWTGVRAAGPKGGRIALFLASHLDTVAPVVTPLEGSEYDEIRHDLDRGGASFFRHLHGRLGGLPSTLLERLWDLVWNGEVSNDTLAPLRSLLGQSRKGKERPRRRGLARSQRRLAYLAPKDVGGLFHNGELKHRLIQTIACR